MFSDRIPVWVRVVERKARALQEITKEAVGIHVLLTRSLFGGGIPRRLLRTRFSSETDFCSFAILIASQNEAPIWASSAASAAKNTPRSRCSSAHQQRSSDVTTKASASLIASRASEYDPQGTKLRPLMLRNIGTIHIDPFARHSAIPFSIHERPSAALPEALRAQPRRTFPPASHIAKF